MLRNWKAWVLLALLIVPIVAYIILGFLWLLERSWLLATGVTVIWIVSGSIWYVLADRWTRSRRSLLPPLDWDAPHTFTPHDRAAWKMVEEEAEASEQVPMATLTQFDLYVETGRRLGNRLARHYHPKTRDPIENVPVIEMLTALELAAEDLNRLCRQIPGADFVTPAHFKQAVQAATYLQRANEIYTYLLPFFSPVTGLTRLSMQKLVSGPAWKNMQQSLVRWFFRAYVNRLGMHLIELYSGRLAIGAEKYRRLTKRAAAQIEEAEEAAPTPVVAVAGAEGVGKSLLIASLEKTFSDGIPEPIRSKIIEKSRDKTLPDRLRTLRFVEIPGYKAIPGVETAREKAARRAAVEAAVEADMLLLVLDASRGDTTDDVEFARTYHEWFQDRPNQEVASGLVVATGTENLTIDALTQVGSSGASSVANDTLQPESPEAHRLREKALRAWLDALKAELPPTLKSVVVANLDAESPAVVAEHTLPALASKLPKAERVAMLRHFQRSSARSKVRRFFSQVGRQGRKMWSQWRSPKESEEEIGS